MQLGEILSKAWTIIWKHKVLWIFGLLTGLSSVNTTSSFSQSSEGQQLPSQLENYLTQLPNWQIALSALMVILVVLLLVVLLIFLGTMGRIGLIRGASLENAVCFDGARVMNPSGLRFPDECCRHCACRDGNCWRPHPPRRAKPDDRDKRRKLGHIAAS